MTFLRLGSGGARVRRPSCLSANLLEPSTGGLNVTKHLNSGSGVLGQDGIHSCHTKHQVIGRDDCGGSEGNAPKRTSGSIDKRSHLLCRQVRRRPSRIEEFREFQPTVAFFSIQVLVEVLERHETIGVSQYALMDSIDDILNGHSSFPTASARVSHSWPDTGRFRNSGSDV
jgi:hypothetical protein